MIETAQLAFIVLGLIDKQANSLEMMETIKPYDVVIANPPFGIVRAHALYVSETLMITLPFGRFATNSHPCSK